MIHIRSYQTSDFQEVREVLEKGNIYWDTPDNEQSLERKIKDHPDSILVAVEDGRVVGTEFIVEDFMPFLFRIAVHPEYRGRGISKELMQKGEEILKERGYNNVNILVAVDDLGLQELYQKRGYEKGRKYVWMTKELK